MYLLHLIIGYLLFYPTILFLELFPIGGVRLHLGGCPGVFGPLGQNAIGGWLGNKTHVFESVIPKDWSLTVGKRSAGKAVFLDFSKSGGRKHMMGENRGNGACFLSAGRTPCYDVRSHHLLLTKKPPDVAVRD